MTIVFAALLIVLAVSDAEAQPSVERGKYLVEVIGACGNCHTPKGPAGELAGKHMVIAAI